MVVGMERMGKQGVGGMLLVCNVAFRWTVSYWVDLVKEM